MKVNALFKIIFGKSDMKKEANIMSENPQKSLINAQTKNQELDELAHYVGRNLPEGYSAYDIAQIATNVLVKMKHDTQGYDLPAVADYLRKGGNPQYLGASLLRIFKKHTPKFAERYEAVSNLFFGAPAN